MLFIDIVLVLLSFAV